MNLNKVLIAGGGTGGHIMPAIAIGAAFREHNVEMLFVGTKDRMEATIVPKYGFNISFIWISAFHRSLRLSTLIFPLKLIVSLVQSFLILKRFKPNVAIGTGGFACGPILYVASLLKIPIYLQEQNSYPGITTRLLQNKAKCVFTAHDHVEKYLTTNNLIKTGNPIRSMNLNQKSNQQIKNKLNFTEEITLSIIGGSQGALSINNAFSKIIDKLKQNFRVNIFWQAGKYSFEKFKIYSGHNVVITDFVDNIDDIYQISDIIITRGGAIALSEISVAGKASIIVPLKSAAANHQYYNAMSYVDENAAILIEDNSELNEKLYQSIELLFQSAEKRFELAENMKKLGITNATEQIVNHIEKDYDN